MELGKGLLVMLLVLVMFSDAEIGDENDRIKNRKDVGQKSSPDEAEDEIVEEDLENAFEHIREIKALRDTILKLIPGSNMFPRDVLLGKQRKGDSQGEENDDADLDDAIAKDNSQETDVTNSWMKAMIAHVNEMKTIEGNDRNGDDDIGPDTWTDGETTIDNIAEEEIVVPLTPEQQEGSVI